MPSEVKTGKAKLEAVVSASLRKKFYSRCKKLNVSAAQRIRDLVQKDLKG